MVSGEFDQGAVLFGPIADMQWPVWAIEIETIKRGVLRQPKGYLIAVLPWVYQINRGPLPRTDNSSSLIEFTGRMLIQCGGYTGGGVGKNSFAQCYRAKPIGQQWVTKCFYQRIENMRCQFTVGQPALGLFRQVWALDALPSFTTVKQHLEGEMLAAGFLYIYGDAPKQLSQMEMNMPR
ncbi:hypothetical protein ACUVJH_00580 [Aeromonas veronii]|uniref:hypothetical protein n=1 Tax=Aeromonas veronii TaxID=654 RepID=UPI004055980A